MNLQYLRAFYVTVKINSISKAAKVLHLTQPGLSMQIQSLEKELQVSLLNRSNKGVNLTDSGKIVFDYADTILSLQENIERDLDNLKNDTKNLLIGSCKSVGEHALPCSIYIYKNDNKDIHISMEISNTQDVIKNLLNRTINIGIIQGRTDNKNLKTEKVTCDRLLLVTSCPVIKDQISREELLKLPIISRENGSGSRIDIEEFLNDNNHKLEDLNIIYELNSLEAIKSSVMSGKGFAFIPELTIKKELKEGTLTNIKVDNMEIISEFYIVYRKDHNLSIYEKEFINFIKSNKRGFC